MLTLLSLWGPALAGDLKRRFADKVVIVIGGTSGIGRAAAPMFPAQGGRAAFCGRNVERGKPVEDEIHETGGDAVFIRAAEVKVIPDTAKEKPSQGEIIAVGPGGRDESGKLVDKTIGVKRIYLLNRANGRIDSDQLLVHKLRREANSHCLGCRSSDISARWLWGYPNLEATATAKAA